MKKRKLTTNEEKFVAYYAHSGNGTQAYVDAFGTKSRETASSQAHNLLRRPEIRLAIDTLIEDMMEDTIADAKEVLEYYTSIMRGEATEEVMIQGQLVERKPLLNDRTRAAEQLSKRFGLDDSAFAKSLEIRKLELMMKKVDLAIAKEQGDEEALEKLDAIMDKIDGELNDKL